MEYTINHPARTQKPAAPNAVGRGGGELGKDRQIRAPNPKAVNIVPLGTK